MRGRITDADGRPLPFVVVTSRTGNGFLSIRSDLFGRFSFPGRSHAPRGELVFKSAGFETRSMPVLDDTTFLDVALQSDSGYTLPGWTLGLIPHPRLRWTDSTSAPVARTDSLVQGALYQLDILSRGSSSCTRRGPGDLFVDSTRITVAVTEYVRGGPCTRDLIEHGWQYPVVIDHAGRGEIRVVGRTSDQLIPIVVAPERMN